MVELRQISKRFDGTPALAEVSVSVERRSVHGLVGENGAGKSTLAKIVAGVHRPDAGRILIDGNEHTFRSPRHALAAGVAIISQEPIVVPTRSVLANVFLGIENACGGVVSIRSLRERFARLCAETGLELPGDAPAGALRVADQQKIEILRAVARRARVIIMDEPTSALSRKEAARLFAIVRQLCAAGSTVMYVSHFLKEVLALADDVTILRDGRVVRTAKARAETPETLVEAILGRPMELAFPPTRPRLTGAPNVLKVRGLTRDHSVRDVDLDLHAGEIVGLAGLVGSGRTELARALFGADRIDAGRIWLEGRPLRLRSPRQAIRAGVGLVPEDRNRDGIIPARPITENVTLVGIATVSRLGVVSLRAEHRVVRAMIERLGIRARTPTAQVRELSGGNQQKVLFARWLHHRPRVLIVDEPTRGVDVGAKLAIYELICEIAATGAAILVISSEHEELLGLAQRVLVMRQGQLVAELEGESMTESAIVNAALGTDATMDRV